MICWVERATETCITESRIYQCISSATPNGMALTGSPTGWPGLHKSNIIFGCSQSIGKQSGPATLACQYSISFVLACGTRLVCCTTLVLAYLSVQLVRGSFSSRPSGLLMDTDHLLDWPELDVPVDCDDPASVGEEQCFSGSPVDSELRTAQRHPLRCHRVAVQAAICVNRVAAERQRRAATADASSGRTPPVLATLDVAHLVSGGASGGIDATSLGRENGVWCGCRVGQGVVGASGETLGGHSLDGGAPRVGDVGRIRNMMMSAARYRFGWGDGRPGAGDILRRICEDRARTGRSDDGGIGRQPTSKLRRLSSHGRRAREC